MDVGRQINRIAICLRDNDYPRTAPLPSHSGCSRPVPNSHACDSRMSCVPGARVGQNLPTGPDDADHRHRLRFTERRQPQWTALKWEMLGWTSRQFFM